MAVFTLVLPKDDRTDSVQEEQLGLPYWTMILAICVVVDESKCLDIPILEFSTTSVHLPFAHPSSLEIMSMTFAAVVCDADDSCSVNPAYDPESSSTMSPRNTTVLL